MKDVGGINKWTDIGCSAHELHLAVTGKCLFNLNLNQSITTCSKLKSMKQFLW